MKTAAPVRRFGRFAALSAIILALSGCTVLPAPDSADLSKGPVDLSISSPADLAMTCVPGSYVWLCGTDCPPNLPTCGGLLGPLVVGQACRFPGGKCEQFDRNAYCDCTGTIVKVECRFGATTDAGSC